MTHAPYPNPDEARRYRLKRFASRWWRAVVLGVSLAVCLMMSGCWMIREQPTTSTYRRSHTEFYQPSDPMMKSKAERNPDMAPATQPAIKSRTVTEVTSEAPGGAVKPASFEVNPVDGWAIAQTGAVQAVDKVMQRAQSDAGVMAGALLLAGLASIAGVWWLGFPIWIPPLLIATAGAVFAFPIVLDRYLLHLLIGGVAIIAIFVVSWWEKIDNLWKDPNTKQKIEKRKAQA